MQKVGEESEQIEIEVESLSEADSKNNFPNFIVALYCGKDGY